MSTIFKSELYCNFSNSTRMNENKQVGHSKQETKQLLDGVEQNIVICLWQADQLFAEAEGWGK